VLAFSQPVNVQKSDKKVTENGQVFFLHSVAAGQTLFSIARTYEVDQAEIIRHNPSAATVLQVGQTLKIPDLSKQSSTQPPTKPSTDQEKGLQIHTVVAGETLFGIARQHNVSAQQIIQSNPGTTNFENLRIGQELRIPAARKIGEALHIQEFYTDSVVIYEAQRGESLFGISKKMDMPQDSLLAWNPELQSSPLKKGQNLRIVYRVKKLVPVNETVRTQPEVVNVWDTVLHRIQDKETIFGLARRYNTTVEKVMEWNPELKDGLKAGYFIYIPVPRLQEQGMVPNTAASTKGCENSRYRTKYKIALLIPLYLDEIDRIFISPATEEQLKKQFFKPFSFIEFYEGILIAVDSMKRAGFSVDLYVYDTGNDTLALKKILAKPEMQYMDLIIGPFFAQNYPLAARFAQQHNIKMVSPFARDPQVMAQNRSVFQMNASSEAKLAELARHIARSYADPNVILVIGNTEADRELSKAFRQSLELHTAAQSRKPNYQEVVYSDKGVTGVSTRLDINKQNVVVNLITGETTISNYLSAMAKLTKNFKITMIGMPDWKDYRTFDLNDLMAVDLHLFGAAFIDYNSPVTISFLRQFRERYKGEPEENYYGFIGYDIGLYFMKALHGYGLDFENCLDQMQYTPVGTGFRWVNSRGQGFENIYLNMYRYTDFSLEPVKQARKP
jgi:LysM repeat protein/ABC-type branched-subunit amino acid transport system substrate-binding protein